MNEHIIYDFMMSLFELSAAMAPYIILGLLIAGVMHETIPESFIKNHLGKDNTRSVIKATLFGIPIPVCSCGVIPLAASLKKSGASKGAVLSFLISTPITGIDSILATYGIFGFAFTIYRIITSIVIAVAAGLATNLFAKERSTFTLAPSSPKLNLVKGTQQQCCESNCGCKNEQNKSFSLKKALSYGFGTLFGDIAKPLLWGLIIGALITVLMPENLADLLRDNIGLSYALVLLIALPMYVCATASLPIAAALVMHGVSLGAAFVFLSAGPATNTVTMGVVKSMLGKRALMIYLATIAVGSIVFGLLLDLWFDGIDIKTIIQLEENTSLFAKSMALLMWIGIFYHLYKAKQKKSCCA